jgi:hypothetical protein
MSTFYPFPRLPAELRDQIWEMIVSPRTVDVRVYSDHSFTLQLASSTPVPAILHTCREARSHGCYQRAFSELDSSPKTERRYVWINLAIDIVSIGSSYIEQFSSVALSIQRLKFARANDDDFWFHSESRKLRLFTNMREFYIVCVDGIYEWVGAVKDGNFPWPCAPENLYFIDPLDDNRMRTGPEMERFFREWRRENWLKEYGETYFTDESEDEGGLDI